MKFVPFERTTKISVFQISSVDFFAPVTNIHFPSGDTCGDEKLILWSDNINSSVPFSASNLKISDRRESMGLVGSEVEVDEVEVVEVEVDSPSTALISVLVVLGVERAAGVELV